MRAAALLLLAACIGLVLAVTRAEAGNLGGGGRGATNFVAIVNWSRPFYDVS